MDFHSLSRKELQALCKKNKIPANITNIAMADALKALDKVEGLDEFNNTAKSDPQQSPEKAMPGSPEVPKTSYRTSTTQRKRITVEPESSQQSLALSRRKARSVVVGEGGQESKNNHLPKTPAIPASRKRTSAASTRQQMETKAMETVEDEKFVDQEKSNVPETPAMQSRRNRAPAVSARKKEEKTVQKVHSTRQSVRLLEKKIGDLSLEEPLNLDGVGNEIEEVDVKDGSGAELLTVSEKDSDKIIDTEVLPCQFLDQALESEREESKHELLENRYKLEDCTAKQEMDFEKCDYSEVLSNSNHSSDKGNEMNSEFQEDCKSNVSEMDQCNPKLEGLDGESEESSNENSGESSPILIVNSEKAVPMDGGFICENGRNVLITACTVTTHPIEVSVSSDCNQFDEAKENATAVTVPEDFFYEKSKGGLVPGSNKIPEEGSNEKSESSLEIPIPSEDENSSNKNSASTVTNPSTLEVSDNSDGNQFDEAEENAIPVPDICYEKSKDRPDNGRDVPEEVSNEKSLTSSTNEFPEAPSKDLSVDGYNDEALVEIVVTEAEETDMTGHDCSRAPVSNETPRSRNHTTPFCDLASEKKQEHTSSENLIDITVTLQEEFGLVAAPAFTEQMNPYQPLAAGSKMTSQPDTLQGPTEITPRKILTKKQLATIQKMTDASSDTNKENVRNLEAKQEKVCEISADEWSLRQLRKMFKEKLQIANKNSEENKDTQVEIKTRMALQTLPENCMLRD